MKSKEMKVKGFMLFSSDIWCGVAQCFEVYLTRSNVTSCQEMALLSTQGAG